MPPQGVCEKELLYKFALKISNLQDLFQKQKLGMDPYDFYRWVVCKNLKSDLHNAMNHTRNGLTGVIRSLGDDSAQSDRVFRCIVLYWASLTGNENKFRKQKKGSQREEQTTRTRHEWSTTPEQDVSAQANSRDLARNLSRLEARRRRRHNRSVTPIFGGVNAHRAARGLAAKSAK